MRRSTHRLARPQRPGTPGHDRPDAATASRWTTRSCASEAGSVAAALADAGVGIGDPVAIDLPAGVAARGRAARRDPRRSRSSSRCRRPAATASTSPPERPISTRRGSPGPGPVGSRGPPFSRHPALPLTRVLSSGTSGTPKPVLLTAGNHLWSALGSALNLGVERDDRWLCCLPLNHVGGLTILIRSAIYGTGAVIQPALRRRSRGRRRSRPASATRRLAGADPARPPARRRRRRSSARACC